MTLTKEQINKIEKDFRECRKISQKWREEEKERLSKYPKGSVRDFIEHHTNSFSHMNRDSIEVRLDLVESALIDLINDIC